MKSRARMSKARPPADGASRKIRAIVSVLKGASENRAGRATWRTDASVPYRHALRDVMKLWRRWDGKGGLSHTVASLDPWVRPGAVGTSGGDALLP